MHAIFEYEAEGIRATLSFEVTSKLPRCTCCPFRGVDSDCKVQPQHFNTFVAQQVRCPLIQINNKRRGK